MELKCKINIFVFLPATFASMILSSVFEEKAEDDDAEPLLGSWTRRVVGSGGHGKVR